MIGGAHTWLYEIYRRWPTEVRVLAAEYSKDHRESHEQREFDHSASGILKISRRARVLPQFDALSLRYASFLWDQLLAIREFAGNKGKQGPVRTTIHSLRAVPEGLPAWLYSKMHPRTTSLVTYVHGEEVLVTQTSRQLRFFARQIYEDSHLVIANSENTRRVLAEAFPQVRSVCIHPGVDTVSYRVARGERKRYRSLLGWPADTIVVLTLARMEPRKNHAMVIRAIAKLRAEQLPIALVCAGDGPERTKVEELAAKLGVSDWVRFIGQVSERDKPILYSAADIFAMPAITVGEMIEGFGIVFVEAAAAGLPTICGLTGGQREAIRDGETGYAVDGTSLDAVASGIRELATKPALRRRFGYAGLKLAAEHDWNVLSKKIQEEVQK